MEEAVQVDLRADPSESEKITMVAVYYHSGGVLVKCLVQTAGQVNKGREFPQNKTEYITNWDMGKIAS